MKAREDSQSGRVTGRLVKRYGNRKLYDTSESRYVTLEEIGRWVKAGEDVKILENDTGEDLTAVTFAQIILEEERRKSGLLSLPVLRNIIQHGEAALQGIAATVDRGRKFRTAPERARRGCILLQFLDRFWHLQKSVDILRRSGGEVRRTAFLKDMRRLELYHPLLEALIARLRRSATAAPPTRTLRHTGTPERAPRVRKTGRGCCSARIRRAAEHHLEIGNGVLPRHQVVPRRG